MNGKFSFVDTFRWSAVLWLAFLAACGKPDYNPELPDASLLGSPRGYRIARVITHFHSPYSYDACDKNGLPGGVPQASCVDHLRQAACSNRIDFMFVTDHPGNMANYPISDLILQRSGDEVINNGSGSPYANRISGCSNGFRPTLLTGIEGRLLALGMTEHLSGALADRGNLYGEENLTFRNRLESEADAVVIVPHTESRAVDLIESLEPNGVEIYNIHANLDPKIRKKDLELPPFQHIPQILGYLIDPYGDLNADFMFMQFMEISSLYFEKWNRLIYGNTKVIGVGGTDSHENIFSQKASDGERLDSHRRMTRYMSNHVLVSDTTVASVKAALREGRSSLVFEGFGSPVGLDLYSTVGSTVAGIGETNHLSGGMATITVSAPTLYADSPGVKDADDPAQIRVELKRVLSDGRDVVVAASNGSNVSYQTNVAGAYRAEIYIRPRHLRPFLSTFEDLADHEYRWIITSHVYLEP